MNLIGITGQKRHGKDTVADYFVKKNYTKLAYADPLKQICAIAFGFSYEQLHGALKEVKDSRWNMTPRVAMQRVGTDLFRNQIDTNIWINNMKHRIEAQNGNVVVNDVRFSNEVKLIRDLGGTIIKVVRPNMPNNDKHITEKPIMDYDIEIINDGTVQDLHNKLKQFG